MKKDIILASNSEIRKQLLRNAGVSFKVDIPSIDETSIKESLEAEDIKIKEIVQILSDMKATNRSNIWQNSLVIAADQILEFDNKIFSKPKNISDAKRNLQILCGKEHRLYTAASIAVENSIIWRDLSISRLKMRDFSSDFIDTYLNNMGDNAIKSVGAYQLESLGIQLFDSISGDYFSILGLPLLPILKFLRDNKLVLD